MTTTSDTSAAPAVAPRPRRRWQRALSWTGVSLGILALLLAAAAMYFVYAPPTPEPDLAADVIESSITVDGMERAYTMVLPDELVAGAPLWIALHGNNMDASGMRSATGYQLDELAAEEGAVVVYPQGYENSWHDCRTATPYTARIEGIDDVAFLESLIGDVAAEYGLDRSRVYGVGYSNGAHMLYRMAAESPGTFAGIEVNAANMSAPDSYGCAPITEPIAVVLVEGTGDPINPYGGGESGMFGQTLGTVLSAEESAAALAHINGVADLRTDTVIGGDPGQGGAVTLTAYGEGTSTPVLLYTVEGGGHVVPNPATNLSRVMGAGTEHLNAPAVAWDLFASLPAASA